jgi:hypothetical protein
MIATLAVSIFAAVLLYWVLDMFIDALVYEHQAARDAAVILSLAAAAFFGVAVFLMLKEYM